MLFFLKNSIEFFKFTLRWTLTFLKDKSSLFPMEHFEVLDSYDAVKIFPKRCVWFHCQKHLYELWDLEIIFHRLVSQSETFFIRLGSSHIWRSANTAFYSNHTNPKPQQTQTLWKLDCVSLLKCALHNTWHKVWPAVGLQNIKEGHMYEKNCNVCNKLNSYGTH